MSAGGGFFRTLNYASVNEDWRTEREALRPGPEDTVLCVTGSGDRPLDLLACGPRRVVAIDLNPAQNHLLALKVAAMRRYEYDEFAAFVGLASADPRWRREAFLALAGDLEPESHAFWVSRLRVIEMGVIYQGRWERFYRRAAALAQWLRPRAIPRLFEFDDLEAQRRFLRESWDCPLWRLLFQAVCSRAVSRFLLRDPAYYAHRAVPARQWLYRRMTGLLERCLARDSFMVSLLLRGRLSPFDLPPYLEPVGYQGIRARLDRLSAVTADLIEFTRERAGAFSRFSLSDVPSFLSAPQFERLLEWVVRFAAPRARVVIRQFLTRYDVPRRLADALERDRDLERRLAAEDHAFAYDFLILDVNGA